MHIQDEIERIILRALYRKGPQTRLQLQRAALNGYMRFDYDPVLTSLLNRGIIEYSGARYKVKSGLMHLFGKKF